MDKNLVCTDHFTPRQIEARCYDSKGLHYLIPLGFLTIR